MEISIDGKIYKVQIITKTNKNTYIRVTPDFIITVSTNSSMKKKDIKKLLLNNIAFLKRAIEKRKKEHELSESFYYLGNKYDVIYVSNMNEVIIDDNKIYTKDETQLKKWIEKEMCNIFNQRLMTNYNIFKEQIPCPDLKLRLMKTRWGVCNIDKQTITLNKNLIKYKESIIDYVIIHELAHFIHPNHSNLFWNIVSKYSPNYKKLRKQLNG